METVNLHEIAKSASNRADFWVELIRCLQLKSVVEVGVWKGEFAAHILETCPSVETYYLVDPWRHLDNWNRPANISHDSFESVYREAIARTMPFKGRVSVLRGTTTEVVSNVKNQSIDLVYIDGDHTLRGIAIDLIRWTEKVRPGGFVGGDDFHPSIWGKHGRKYELTMIFPFAVYFAEALGYRIYGLPYHQFLIEVSSTNSAAHQFLDFTGKYGRVELRQQCRQPLASFLDSSVRRVTPGWVRGFVHRDC